MKDIISRRRKEIKDFFDKMSKEEFLRSLEESEFDYYKNLKTQLFKINIEETWSGIHLNTTVRIPCPLQVDETVPIGIYYMEYWRGCDQIREELKPGDINILEFDIAA